jgi:hypothetical protein
VPNTFAVTATGYPPPAFTEICQAGLRWRAMAC